MARYHGYKGQVKADPSGGATLVAIASLNAWMIDMSKDTVDVTAFQDTNKVYVAGLNDLKGTIGGWWDSADDTIFDIAMGTVPCALELTPTTLVTPTPPKWSGPAWLDASIDVKANGAITVAGKFVASGAWTRVGVP